MAPEGSAGNVPLELPVLKMYYDHPTFAVKNRNPDDVLEEGDDSDGFGSIVSSFKSRMDKRKQEKVADENKKFKETPDDHQFIIQARSTNM